MTSIYIYAIGITWLFLGACSLIGLLLFYWKHSYVYEDRFKQFTTLAIYLLLWPIILPMLLKELK